MPDVFAIQRVGWDVDYRRVVCMLCGVVQQGKDVSFIWVCVLAVSKGGFEDLDSVEDVDCVGLGMDG